MSEEDTKAKDGLNIDVLDQMIKETMPADQADEGTRISEQQPSAEGENISADNSSITTDSHNKRPIDPQLEADASNKRSKQDNLELELEMAIESHNRELQLANESAAADEDKHEGKAMDVESSNNARNEVDSPQSLSQMNQDQDSARKTVMHSGFSIPADSELFSNHQAYAAYTELSNHYPTSLTATNSNHLAALPLALTAADYLPPRIQLLVNTLPSLDNLASQILRIFTLGSYQGIIDLVSSPETAQGAVFNDLTSLFEFTKKLYSEDDPFLSVSHIAPGIWRLNERPPTYFKNREQCIESTLRKVNLATFLLATLGVIEVGFFYLNESFLNIFCPLNNLDPETSISNNNEKNSDIHGGSEFPVGDKIGKLLKPQAILYLDLKTQAYISAIEAGERSREEILSDIFPDDLEQLLLEKRNVKTLSPAEADFIERCKGRKSLLLSHPDNSTLSEEYEWFQFLKSLFEFIGKNMVFLIWGNKKVSRPSGNNVHKPTIATTASHNEAIAVSVSANNSNPGTAGPSLNSGSPDSRPNPMTKDDLAAYADTLLPSEILEQQLHVNIANNNNKSRLSNRRPWTREEEKALRQALELKGPHWSSILELYGAGGKISEALKNRNQVQLKDKARNWKRFFLKSDLPVPSYLQKVTGDLDNDKLRRAKRNAAAPIPNLPKK